jgi:hypothetical protein
VPAVASRITKALDAQQISEASTRVRPLNGYPAPAGAGFRWPLRQVGTANGASSAAAFTGIAIPNNRAAVKDQTAFGLSDQSACAPVWPARRSWVSGR